MKRFVHPILVAVTTLGSLVPAQVALGQTPIVSVIAAPTNEGLIGLEVTFSLSSPAVGGERLNFDLSEGTATFDDFIPFEVGIVDFAAGETSQSIFITMIDDIFPEADETFAINLTEPTGLIYAAPSYSLTIVNDDDPILLPSFFSDGMVLQREKGAKFWGYACPGCSVTIDFAGRTWTTNSASDGRFEVVLDDLAASAVERDLTITVNDDSTTITGVLVGEVWMGAGQSNMEFPFSFLPSAQNDAEVASANDPLLRLYLPIEQARENPVNFIEGSWLSAVAGDMPDFPALPYHIAKRLRAELGVPVAIIECAWGGQRIEGFISEESLLTFPEGADAIAEKNFFYDTYLAFEDELAAWQANPVGPQPVAPGDDPRFEAFLGGQIYNGMISPLAGYGLRGVFFYQGEANTFGFSSDNYQAFMEVLVDDWRETWGEELPFYYMQLANFVSEQRPKWVNVQNEQRLTLANLTSVGMSIGNDIGNPDDIHPTDKTVFADRFVRWPLLNEYGQSDLIPTGPLYSSSTVSGGNVTVQFDYSNGLTTSDSLAPDSFQLRADSGSWVDADAAFDGESIVVSSTSVPDPTEVRYAWDANPTSANLVNSAGLPASVFVATLGPDITPVLPTAMVSASPVNEGASGLPVQVTLSEPAQGGEEFSFELLNGTASAGEDFIPFQDNTVVFLEGQTSQTFVLTLIDDSEVEPDENFTLSLFNPSGLIFNQSSLELTILNDDTEVEPEPEPILPTATVAAFPVNEGASGLPVQVTLSEPAQGGEEFSFELLNGTASAGEDFLNSVDTTVVFLEGQTSQTLVLTLIDDSVIEPDENFTLSLFNPSGLLLAQSSLELTILNDDMEVEPEPEPEPEPTLPTVTVSASPINEGLIGLPVQVTLSEAAQGGEEFSFELLDGTAAAGEDFLPWLNGRVVFQAGETSQTLVLTLVDDSVIEPDENFTLSLFNPSGLSLSQSLLELTILNDDMGAEPEPEPETTITVTASAEPTNEGLIGLPVHFELSAPAEGGEQFNFTLVAGSANPDEDYIPWLQGVVGFAAGETSQTIYLTLVDDAVIEPNETFTILFSAPSGVSLSQDELELTIVNDDSVLDDYGFRFGLTPEQRSIHSDDDNDGIGLFLEYAFNLNPTIAESPTYVAGELDAEGEPFGMPSIITKSDDNSGSSDIFFVFIRRSDSYPKVEYFAEISQDNMQFEVATPDLVTPIGDHWEEVRILIGGSRKPGINGCFARVRVVANDDNGDGF